MTPFGAFEQEECTQDKECVASHQLTGAKRGLPRDVVGPKVYSKKLSERSSGVRLTSRRGLSMVEESRSDRKALTEKKVGARSRIDPTAKQDDGILPRA
jgi:hypothetical protein